MRILIFLFGLTAGFAPVQAQLLDDFSDGNIHSNPYWFGDTAQFQVVNGELQLQAIPQTDTSYLSTPINPPDSASWAFTFELDFNPSSSNYLRWYPLADEPDLTASQNAYYLQIGGASNDRVSLRKLDMGTGSILWESADDFVDADPVSLTLKVTYSHGLWSVYQGQNGGWIPLGSASDTLSRPYFNTGIWCRYTATRSDKFTFDDFYYEYQPWIDLQNPFVTQYMVTNPSLLKLQFNEIVFADNIRLRKWGTSNWFDAHPDRESGSEFNITLDQSMLSGALYQIELAEWSDLSGRTLDTTWMLGFYKPRYRSLIFTEIMADPSPTVGLPDKEYIEIFNRSGHEIELKNLRLLVGEKEFQLPAVRLQPDSFYVIYDGPSLANSGGDLMLMDFSGRLIDAVSYSDNQHALKVKKDGGWSLTLVDTLRSCYGKSSWQSSIHPLGGTPGFMGNQESIEQPGNRVLYYFEEDSRIELNWFHALDSVYWFMNPPEVIESNIVFERMLGYPFDQEEWNFLSPIPEEGVKIYWPHGSRDCRQRHFWPDTFLIAPVQKADSADWRVNEIMYEPDDGQPEWIEIVNHSDKVLDLGELHIGEYNPTFEVFESFKKFRDQGQAVLPGARLVLTSEVEPLWQKYSEIDSFQVFVADEWLALTNDSMQLALANSGMEVLELFRYESEMHLPYLDNTGGVSLERLSPGSVATHQNSWHSSAIALGGATPTQINSHSGEAQSGQVAVSAPSIFTPNGDGYNDVVRLKWISEEPGEWARIQIIDATGRPVYTLNSGANLPNEIDWVWSGQSDGGNLCQAGVYWWWVELMSLEGRVKTYRIPFVLSF